MYQDQICRDGSHPGFQAAFRAYFGELGITVRDWEGLFREMAEDPNGLNYTWLRTGEQGQVIGFLMVNVCPVSSWFFSWETGFLREFWIAPPFRNQGHGSALLKLAEEDLLRRGIRQVCLTTTTAEAFYLRHGYRKHPEINAKNQDPVYGKFLE